MAQIIIKTTIKDGRPDIPLENGQDEDLYLCHNEGDGFSINQENDDGSINVWVQSTLEVIQYLRDNYEVVQEIEEAEVNINE